MVSLEPRSESDLKRVDVLNNPTDLAMEEKNELYNVLEIEWKSCLSYFFYQATRIYE